MLILKLVIGKCIALADLLVLVLKIALNQKVGLADGISLLVQFLAVQVDFDIVATGHLLYHLLCHRKHTSGSAARVIDREHLTQLLKLLLLSVERQAGQKSDNLARRVILACFGVRGLLRPPDHNLKHGTHLGITYLLRIKVSLLDKGLYNGVQLVALLQPPVNLSQVRRLAVLVNKVRQDILHIVGKPFEIGLEIRRDACRIR